jgi:NAD(P)H dehydrogenase (quinone)
MAKVLVVYASVSGNTKAAAEAVAEGARSAGAEVTLKPAEEAQRQDLLDCDAVALGCYDVFDCMAGDLQSFLERASEPGRKRFPGKLYGAFLTCGETGRAITSIQLMAEMLELKSAATSVCVKGYPDQRAVADLKALGAQIAKAAG